MNKRFFACGLTSRPRVSAGLACLMTLVLVLAACSKTSNDANQPAVDLDTLKPKDARLAQLYERSCQACHAQPGGVAPMVGDTKAWAPRLDKGMDALVDSVKRGVDGMPAGGLCTECTDTDTRQLIQFMSQEATQ